MDWNLCLIFCQKNKQQRNNISSDQRNLILLLMDN